jgi:anti-sigma B factor antagonist
MITRPLPFEPPFGLELAETERGRALALRGGLDLLTRVRVEGALAGEEATGAPVSVLDLRALDFMDCAGLDCVIAAARGARSQGRRLAVLIGAGRGRRLFDLLDLTAEVELIDEGSGA